MSARTWGARFSLTDGLALAAGGALTWLLHDTAVGAARWVVGVPFAALGHFFLFCNVFRVRRRYELLWTASFLANVLAWHLAGELSWTAVLAVQTPLTLLAIVAEVRSPQYHGVLARRVNPRLDAWLAGDDDWFHAGA